MKNSIKLWIGLVIIFIGCCALWYGVDISQSLVGMSAQTKEVGTYKIPFTSTYLSSRTEKVYSAAELRTAGRSATGWLFLGGFIWLFGFCITSLAMNESQLAALEKLEKAKEEKVITPTEIVM